MAQKNLVQVFLSVTTLDHELARKMEPRASAPRRRIEAIRNLSAAGVPVGVMNAPVIPFLTDSGIEAVLEAAAAAGARHAAYVLMRLPWELKELFVVDGSVLPTSLGVNPQVSVMAMATRLAWKLAERPLR